MSAGVETFPLGVGQDERISEGVCEPILADSRAGSARYRDPTGALHLPLGGALITAEPA